MRLSWAVCAAAAALSAAGCGGGPKTAPVSGTVLVDGKPMANLAVVFQPIGSKANENPGRGSYGTTDSNGKYTLFVDGASGAVVGKHKVAIFTNLSKDQLTSTPADTGSTDGEEPASAEIIPPKYNDMTELTFDVPPGGTDKADFKVESIPKPAKKKKK